MSAQHNHDGAPYHVHARPPLHDPTPVRRLDSLFGALPVSPSGGSPAVAWAATGANNDVGVGGRYNTNMGQNTANKAMMATTNANVNSTPMSVSPAFRGALATQPSTARRKANSQTYANRATGTPRTAESAMMMVVDTDDLAADGVGTPPAVALVGATSRLAQACAARWLATGTPVAVYDASSKHVVDELGRVGALKARSPRHAVELATSPTSRANSVARSPVVVIFGNSPADLLTTAEAVCAGPYYASPAPSSFTHSGTAVALSTDRRLLHGGAVLTFLPRPVQGARVAQSDASTLRKVAQLFAKRGAVHIHALAAGGALAAAAGALWLFLAGGGGDLPSQLAACIQPLCSGMTMVGEDPAAALNARQMLVEHPAGVHAHISRTEETAMRRALASPAATAASAPGEGGSASANKVAFATAESVLVDAIAAALQKRSFVWHGSAQTFAQHRFQRLRVRLRELGEQKDAVVDENKALRARVEQLEPSATQGIADSALASSHGVAQVTERYQSRLNEQAHAYEQQLASLREQLKQNQNALVLASPASSAVQRKLADSALMAGSAIDNAIIMRQHASSAEERHLMTYEALNAVLAAERADAAKIREQLEGQVIREREDNAKLRADYEMAISRERRNLETTQSNYQDDLLRSSTTYAKENADLRGRLNEAMTELSSTKALLTSERARMSGESTAMKEAAQRNDDYFQAENTNLREENNALRTDIASVRNQRVAEVGACQERIAALESSLDELRTRSTQKSAEDASAREREVRELSYEVQTLTRSLHDEQMARREDRETMQRMKEDADAALQNERHLRSAHLEEKESSFRAHIQALEEEREDFHKRESSLKELYRTHRDESSRVVASLSAQLDSLREELANQTNAARAENASAAEKLRENARRIAELEESRSVLEQEAASRVAVLTKQLADKEEISTRLAAQMQQKFEASLSAVQKDKQFQVESLERQLAEANLHLGSNSAELTKQMHAERERYQEELSRVESRFRAELAASRSELADAVAHHEKQQLEARVHHESLLAQIREQSDARIETAAATNKEALNDLKQMHAIELEALKRQASEATAANKRERENEISHSNELHSRELSSKEEEVVALRAELSQMSRQMESELAQADARLREARKSHASALDESKKRHANATTELQAELEKAASDMDELRAKSLEQHDHFLAETRRMKLELDNTKVAHATELATSVEVHESEMRAAEVATEKRQVELREKLAREFAADQNERKRQADASIAEAQAHHRSEKVTLETALADAQREAKQKSESLTDDLARQRVLQTQLEDEKRALHARLNSLEQDYSAAEDRYKTEGMRHASEHEELTAKLRRAEAALEEERRARKRSAEEVDETRASAEKSLRSREEDFATQRASLERALHVVEDERDGLKRAYGNLHEEHEAQSERRRRELDTAKAAIDDAETKLKRSEGELLEFTDRTRLERDQSNATVEELTAKLRRAEAALEEERRARKRSAEEVDETRASAEKSLRSREEDFATQRASLERALHVVEDERNELRDARASSEMELEALHSTLREERKDQHERLAEMERMQAEISNNSEKIRELELRHAEQLASAKLDAQEAEVQWKTKLNELNHELRETEIARSRAEKKAEAAIEAGRRALEVVGGTVDRTKAGVQSAFATKQRHEEEVTAKASQALREAQEATMKVKEKTSELETKFQESIKPMRKSSAERANFTVGNTIFDVASAAQEKSLADEIATIRKQPEKPALPPPETGRADEGGEAAEAFLSSAARDCETISKASGANSVGSIAARAGRVLQSSWNEPDGAWQTLFGETFTATALVAVIRMFYAMHLSARGGGVEAPPLSASEAMESHKLERQLGWRRIGLNRKVNRVWTFVRGAEARGGLDLGVVASAGALPDVVSAILERLGIVDSMAMCDDWSRISSSVSFSDVGKTSKRSAVAAALYVYCACVDKAIRARVAEST
ncbi:hypothetical protein RI054_01g05090 [Pseudoscourfieldia marina]